MKTLIVGILFLQASWYSVESLKEEGTWRYSHGTMANGEQFRDNGLTAASCDYPIGSVLRVCRYGGMDNRSVVVTVTDKTNKRFKGKRIDLSKRAFAQIADLEQGVIQVRVEKVK